MLHLLQNPDRKWKQQTDFLTRKKEIAQRAHSVPVTPCHSQHTQAHLLSGPLHFLISWLHKASTKSPESSCLYRYRQSPALLYPLQGLLRGFPNTLLDSQVFPVTVSLSQCFPSQYLSLTLYISLFACLFCELLEACSAPGQMLHKHSPPATPGPTPGLPVPYRMPANSGLEGFTSISPQGPTRKWQRHLQPQGVRSRLPLGHTAG